MRKKYFRSLEIKAKNYINTYFSGTHSSSLKDSLIDVDVVRDYQPGDKRLDSKASLRTSRAMARVFNPERALTLFILYDLSPSQYTKRDASIITALYLSYLADLLNDRIGMIVFSDKVLDIIEPSESHSQVAYILEKHLVPEESETTNLDVALLELDKLQLDNTLFVIISDFCFDVSEKTSSLLRRLNTSNNYSIAIILSNNQDWHLGKLPFIIDFKDSESNEHVNWHSENENGLVEWRANIKSKCWGARIEPIFLEVNANNFLMPLVKYFLRTANA